MKPIPVYARTGALPQLGIWAMEEVLHGRAGTDTETARWIYLQYRMDDSKDCETEISKLRRMLLLGKHPCGPALCNRVLQLYDQFPKSKRKPLYTVLVNAARLQLKYGSILPDETIGKIILRPLKEDAP